MAYPKHIWNQLKNLTASDLISALQRDGWTLDNTKGSAQVFIKKESTNRRVAIHFYPAKTYGAAMLRGLLNDIDWNEQDLRRLKLIK